MIQLYSFDLALMSWSVAPISVQFIIEKDPVGTVDLTTMSKDLGTAVWVVKEYLEDAAAAGFTNQWPWPYNLWPYGPMAHSLDYF